MHLTDKSIFKTEDYQLGVVHKLWFSCDGEERLAKLEGALEGEARQELWDYQLQFDFPEKDHGHGDGDDEDEGLTAEQVEKEREQLKQLKAEAAVRRAQRQKDQAAEQQ